MKKLSLYLIVAVSLSLYSCEEVCTPIPDPVIVPEGRVIMIEELTGVSCTPCAAASAILEDIIINYDGAVVAYGIHGNFQTEPRPDSKYDFSNADAEEMESFLINFSKPAASFNRTESPDMSLVYVQPASWQSIVDQEVAKPQVADVFIASNYDEVTRRADITVTVRPIENISGPINLVIAISESNLIDPQSAVGGDIIDFKHKHVLKKLLTSVMGDPIASSGIASGESIQSMYSYTIPEELNGEWIPENMEITAFITAEDRNGEIQQAAQIHLTE